ncbi:MAG: hypothetical protein Q8L45_14155 [Xanthomonadaceae bacterium]|nr:hypothetical protein [Xanthomonadaceae bacterium]MDP2186693.1 hypothetical protein [Xanthomonadales bacterium]MDZ4116163.1 hypothetical protein [Xanthomonadaceae bacterium]MDZ4378621.1 hypothetical protein [Xanthomonadaceae bacterium]
METLVQFGPRNQLVGILNGGTIDAPLLVLPNSGIVPRAGLFRLHVDLARMLEVRGVPTFRFDLPGVGEAQRIAGCDHRQATRAAMDHLQAHYGHGQFIIGGICSAADLGWRMAIDDPRIVGLLMLDGITFPGPWFQFGRFMAVLKRSPLQWPAVALRLLRRSRSTQPALVASDYRDWPDRDTARKELSALVKREVQSLWIYTGGVSDRFLHRREFYWAFGKAARSDTITLFHWPDCDHTFFTHAHRDRLLAKVSNWLGDRYADRERGR